MNALRILSYRLPVPHIARFERWATYTGAGLVMALPAVYLQRHADLPDLLLGIGLALVACLLVLLYGALAGLLPAGQSVGLLGQGVTCLGCLTIGALGAWLLPAFAAGEARLVIGLLVIFCSLLTVSCLGLCVTLRRSGRAAPPG
jgi:hypothetical protein